MSLLEETVGEFKVRLISTAVTFTAAVSIVAVLINNNETNRGSFVTLVTSQVVSSGN
jgi:hypothetical protein